MEVMEQTSSTAGSKLSDQFQLPCEAHEQGCGRRLRAHHSSTLASMEQGARISPAVEPGGISKMRQPYMM